MNAKPLFLTHISIPGPLEQHPGPSKIFFKIYEGLKHVHTTGKRKKTQPNYLNKYKSNFSYIFFLGIYQPNHHHQPLQINTHGLRLRGDILIRCYHVNGDFSTQNGDFGCRSPNGDFGRRQRSLYFSLQFHTCAGNRTMRLGKRDLDVAFRGQ